MFRKDFDVFIFKNILILLIMPIDFYNSFFINVIWSNYFNLLSIITLKNLVLFTLVLISYL